MSLFMRCKNKVNLLVPGVHRTSRSQMFFKIVVRKNFANFTGKHLCWSRPVILLKRDSNTGIFLWNLLNFKNNFFYRTTLATSVSTNKPHKFKYLYPYLNTFHSYLNTLESRIIVPPLIVNFLIFFFHPGHLYSNPPIVNFQSFLLTFLSVNSHFHHSPS